MTDPPYLPDPSKFQFSISRLTLAMLATGLLMVIDLPFPTQNVVFNKALLTVGSVAAILLYDPGKKLLAQASHWTAEERFEDAIGVCEEYIQRYPGKPDGYSQRGFVHYHADDLQAAKSDFEKALERDQHCGNALLGTALCLLQEGELQSSLELFQQASLRGESRGSASYWYAFVSLLVGEVEQAQQGAVRAAKHPEFFHVSHGLLAKIALFEQRYRDVLTHAQFAAPEGEVDADVAILHAIGEYKLGRHQSALRDIEMACEQEPDNASGWATFSWFLSTCPDDSIRDGNRALELAMLANRIEDNSTAWSSIAAAQAELGNFERAVEWAQKAAEQTGEFRKDEMQTRLKTYQAGEPFRDRGVAGASR